MVQLTPDQLEHEFRDRSLYRGTILILSPSDALDLISRAQAARLPILGLDGFFLTDHGIEPSMANSVDYSTGGTVDDTWSAAQLFVTAHGGTVTGFEVVLGESQAPAA